MFLLIICWVIIEFFEHRSYDFNQELIFPYISLFFTPISFPFVFLFIDNVFSFNFFAHFLFILNLFHSASCQVWYKCRIFAEDVQQAR